MSIEPVRLSELVAGVEALARSELGRSLGIRPTRGIANLYIYGLQTIDADASGALSFVSNPRYRNKLPTTKAHALFCAPELAAEVPPSCVALCTAEPYLAYALASQWWAQHLASASYREHSVLESEAPAVHPSAVVAPSARLGAGVRVGPQVVIGARTNVGEGAHIDAACVLGDDVEVGEQSLLHPRVVVGSRCRLGKRNIVHSGVVIGADGFGFAPNGDSGWVKIAQLGAVIIGDDVEIGANTCIDRGALGDTVLGDGVKLDNLIQIGHNVRIGDHTAMAGCVGIAGSAVIGARCTLGGGAVVLGHLSLADGVHVSAASVVTRSILKPGHYTGFFPIDDNDRWERNAVSLRQLDALRRRVKSLENLLGAADSPPTKHGRQ